jgi:hypothetical protein
MNIRVISGPVLKFIVSGKISLIDICSKKVINGCFQSQIPEDANLVIGDIILTGYCSINGKGHFEFEVGLGDEGKGKGAIGRDYIFFAIPSCGYNVNGTLCAGGICLPSEVIPPPPPP